MTEGASSCPLGTPHRTGRCAGERRDHRWLIYGPGARLLGRFRLKEPAWFEPVGGKKLVASGAVWRTTKGGQFEARGLEALEIAGYLLPTPGDEDLAGVDGLEKSGARAVARALETELWAIGCAVSVKFEDYYKVLGVSRSASQEQLQKAFRKLARKSTRT